MQAAQNIQGTAHAGNCSKQNVYAHLTKNGYICNNVDKVFHTYHHDNVLMAILSTIVDDFLLSFKTTTIRDKFFTFMGDAFDVTNPGYKQELTFLSLQDKGISLDQTQYIHTNILLDWYKDNLNFKGHDNPIKAYPIHKYDLSQSLPLQPDDLHHYEQKYHGAYNHTIGKLLHAQQWSRPDLNYAISRLAVYVKKPTSMAFEALDHLMGHLQHHLHEPIFYPAKQIGPDESITYCWSKNQSSMYNKKSTYIYHVDAAFANILPDR